MCMWWGHGSVGSRVMRKYDVAFLPSMERKLFLSNDVENNSNIASVNVVLFYFAICFLREWGCIHKSL